MKSRILTLTAAALLLFSCGTKKTAAVAPVAPVAPAVTETVKAAELTPELAAGKNLYENSCARCHKLFEPKKFTQEDWKPVLVRMQKKAHLDDTQMASISNYITSQL
jgi:cytochrome c5